MTRAFRDIIEKGKLVNHIQDQDQESFQESLPFRMLWLTLEATPKAKNGTSEWHTELANHSACWPSTFAISVCCSSDFTTKSKLAEVPFFVVHRRLRNGG